MDGIQKIQNVWAYNLDQEMGNIRRLLGRYHYVSIDTEFPGIVVWPVGDFKNPLEFQYQTLRCNVDLLNVIQLGLTFSDEDGNVPDGHCTWQFHFTFSLGEDMYAPEAINLLTKSGIDFRRHEVQGIDITAFGDAFMGSGMIMNEDICWISFHSGYDFGYLLRALTASNLPSTEENFFSVLKTYFPIIYDVKYLMKSCKNLKGGLQDLADDLRVQRIGPKHQAGSDCLLTSQTFFRLKKLFFNDVIDNLKYSGRLYGLSSPQNKAAS